MPAFSAFNSTHFSSRPPAAQLIYEDLVRLLGDGENYTTEFDSAVGARLYALAMTLGAALEACQRAGTQFRPDLVLELLPALEREYGLTPDSDATIQERRADLAAAMRIARGARRDNVEVILSTILGSDFVQYVTVAQADAVGSTGEQADGIYLQPGTARSVFRLTGPVTSIGAPFTVGYESIAGASAALAAGDKIAIDTANPGRLEIVEVDSVGVGTFTATFANPHDSGLVFGTGRFPNWWSSKRENVVVMSATGAVSERQRRRANRSLRRLLRGVSTWHLTDGSGPFTVGGGMLGVTTIGAVP